MRGIVDKPLVVTIRTRAEGGELALTPDAYAAHCRALLAHGGVDVLDIEWRACGAFRAELRDAAHEGAADAENVNVHDAWDRIRGEEPEEPKNRLGRISSAGPRIVPRRRPAVAPRSATSPVRRA